MKNTWTEIEALPAICGIYLLLIKDRVFYVGQSVNVYSRLAQHRTERQFDKAMFIEVKQRDLARVEKFFILTLRPKWNRVGMKRPGRSPHKRHAMKLLTLIDYDRHRKILLWKQKIEKTLQALEGNEAAKKQFLKVLGETWGIS